MANIILKEKHNDVMNGVIAVFSGGLRTRNVKWMKTSSPVSVNMLDPDGKLKFLSDGHVVYCSNEEFKICVYNPKVVDYATANYILTPSTTSGAYFYLQEILK